MDVLSDIRRSPMGRFQIVAVTVALVLILIDGFDVAVMSYAAPAISRQWHIDPVMLGYLLSASLFGMAAGSILLTPLADRIGRRPLTLISMGIISVGMVLSIVAADAGQLLAFRVITGLGVGGMMANLNVLVSEYASDRRRGPIIGIYAAGYPIGATLGGLAAGPLIPAFGWHSAFVAGAVLSVAMLVATFFLLPESLDFLLVRRPANALARANAIFARMGRPALAALPVLTSDAPVHGNAAVREVLGTAKLFRTLMLWIGYAFLVAAYYFANTWTPKIMAGASGNDSLGVTVGTVANFGGILGCFIFSALAIRYRSNRLLTGSLVAAAAAYVVFGLAFSQIALAVALAVLLGILTTAGIAGFYAVAPGVYSAGARATGMGWMIGLGRLISIVAPILVGYLISGGWAPQNIFLLFAVPLLGAAAAIVALSASLRRARAGRAAEPTAADAVIR